MSTKSKLEKLLIAKSIGVVWGEEFPEPKNRKCPTCGAMALYINALGGGKFCNRCGDFFTWQELALFNKDPELFHRTYPRKPIRNKPKA